MSPGATTLCFTFLYFFLLILFYHKGDTLRSSARARPQVFLTPEKAASVFWIRFIYSAGVPLSCDMAVKRAGASIVFCTSEELPPIDIHSSINLFFHGLTDWDLLYKQLTLCVTFPFLWSYQVLVWHHCHQVFTSS